MFHVSHKTVSAYLANALTIHWRWFTTCGWVTCDIRHMATEAAKHIHQRADTQGQGNREGCLPWVAAMGLAVLCLKEQVGDRIVVVYCVDVQDHGDNCAENFAHILYTSLRNCK